MEYALAKSKDWTSRPISFRGLSCSVATYLNSIAFATVFLVASAFSSVCQPRPAGLCFGPRDDGSFVFAALARGLTTWFWTLLLPVSAAPCL